MAVRRILQLIQKLGLLVNVLKSNMNPSQVLYLKSVLNTRMSVFPSDERYKYIVEMITIISEMKCVKAQKILRL